MSMPFYVSPEQQMTDRAEFARKGISRGRSVVVLACEQGIVFVADNPSRSLRKVSELYDRIGFAAVGRYNEFEALRVAGIRQADLRGYSYDRSDVTARSLVGQYSQLLGGAFASAGKPYEVELAVAELGDAPGDDVVFHINYDGTITEHASAVALGRNAERIMAVLEDTEPTADLRSAATRAREALVTDESEAPTLEVAVLDRTVERRRRFRRLGSDERQDWLT